MSYTVEVAGKNMQPDFEPVFERKIHQFLNCVEGQPTADQNVRDAIAHCLSIEDIAAIAREQGLSIAQVREMLK